MSEKLYYCSISGEESGPFSAKQLRELVKEGRLRETDSVRSEQPKNWHIAGDTKGLFSDMASSLDSGSAIIPPVFDIPAPPVFDFAEPAPPTFHLGTAVPPQVIMSPVITQPEPRSGGSSTLLSIIFGFVFAALVAVCIWGVMELKKSGDKGNEKGEHDQGKNYSVHAQLAVDPVLSTALSAPQAPTTIPPRVAKPEPKTKFREDELVDFVDFLKKRGLRTQVNIYNQNLTRKFDWVNMTNLVKYGSYELQKKLEKADAFDRPAVEKQIKAEVGGIINKKFFIDARCGTFHAGKVGDNVSSCLAGIELPFHRRNYVPSFREEQIDGLNFSYKPTEASSGFMGSDNTGNITISASGSTDKIKELVRSEKKITFRIVFTNLETGGGAMGSTIVYADILDVKKVDMPEDKDEPKPEPVNELQQKMQSIIDNGPIDEIVNFDEWVKICLVEWKNTTSDLTYDLVTRILSYGTPELSEQLRRTDEIISGNAATVDAVQAQEKAKQEKIKIQHQIDEKLNNIAGQKFYSDTKFSVESVKVAEQRTSVELSISGRRLSEGINWTFCFPGFRCVAVGQHGRNYGRQFTLTGNTEDMREFTKNPNDYILRRYFTGTSRDSSGVNYTIVDKHYEIRKKDSGEKPFGGDPFGKITGNNDTDAHPTQNGTQKPTRDREKPSNGIRPPRMPAPEPTSLPMPRPQNILSMILDNPAWKADVREADGEVIVRMNAKPLDTAKTKNKTCLMIFLADFDSFSKGNTPFAACPADWQPFDNETSPDIVSVSRPINPQFRGKRYLLLCNPRNAVRQCTEWNSKLQNGRNERELYDSVLAEAENWCRYDGNPPRKR
jgi:hypothetical protein